MLLQDWRTRSREPVERVFRLDWGDVLSRSTGSWKGWLRYVVVSLRWLVVSRHRSLPSSIGASAWTLLPLKWAFVFGLRLLGWKP